MTLKMECQIKIGMLLKMEFYSKWNDTQNGMPLKMECHSKLNVTQMEGYSKWKVTQN